jgi:hypothetical protein
MIEILLHGLKMDPLVSLHYYAPVCAVINLLVLPFTEGLEPFYEIAAGNISWGILLSNALVAFLLNVAAIFLVSAGNGVVLTLAGVFKVSFDTVRSNDGGSETRFLKRIFYLSLALCFCSVHLSPHYKSLVSTISPSILTFARRIMDIRLLCRAVRTCLVQNVRDKVGRCGIRCPATSCPVPPVGFFPNPGLIMQKMLWS